MASEMSFILCLSFEDIEESGFILASVSRFREGQQSSRGLLGSGARSQTPGSWLGEGKAEMKFWGQQ